METYVLADKVIAQQHMTSSQEKPKYLKKYDLPPKTTKTRIRTTPHRRPFHPIAVVDAPRTKDLLRQIAKTKDSGATSHYRTKIEKYFTLSSEPYREICKKNKNALLVRKLEPKSQQYDANFVPVSRRAPCWGFSPKRSHHQISTDFEEAPLSLPQTRQKKREPKAKPLQMCEFIDRQEKINRQPKEANQLRLQYCEDELGKCTVQIFKKYNLDSDPYFKKFLESFSQ